MRRTPHRLAYTGYFDSLSRESLSKFASSLASVKENLGAYFSVLSDEKHESVAEYRFSVTSDVETIESDNFEPEILEEFVETFCSSQWENAWVSVQHGVLTNNLKLRHIGAYQDEIVEVAFDSDIGACQLSAHLRDNETTRSFLAKISEDLQLSDKPKKASRYIAPHLETKLLCDSMHLCNVCREPGVIIHHIVPVENNGPSSEENLIVLRPESSSSGPFKVLNGEKSPR